MFEKDSDFKESRCLTQNFEFSDFFFYNGGFS